MKDIIMQRSPIELSSVSVEADNAVLSTDRNIYIPSSRQKKSSQDACDLLRRMAIPQLVIIPGESTIKDVFGNIVPVYINYHEALPDELKGMNMTDVRRVEFIEFPTDPRFKGERSVVNFIVQEYEYGGYTKVSESYRTLNGMHNNTDVFSRFTYKKLTYDVYAGSENRDYRHAGTDNSALYMLGSVVGPTPVTRNETLKESHIRTDKFPVTVRASYATPRFTARSALSFTHFSSPERYEAGSLETGSRPETDFNFTRCNPNRNNTVYSRSDIWSRPGDNISFEITPTFSHTHRDEINSYGSTMMPAPIVNTIVENAYRWEVQTSGRINLGDKHQFSLSMAGGQNINKLTYEGTNNASDSYYNTFGAATLSYRYSTRKCALSTFAGLALDHNSMNGIMKKDVHPRAGINVMFSPDRRSRISAYLYYQTTTPDIALRANDTVRLNEYMYITANPRLDNWRNLTSNLAYNLYCGNRFSLGAFSGYDHDFDRVASLHAVGERQSADT